MVDRLKGRTALVTGGNTGIGRAVAEAFAGEGADIAFTYLQDERSAKEVVRRIEAEGRRALALPCDQRDRNQVEAVMKQAGEALGPPFILVNNAGVDNAGDMVADLSDEDWDDVLKTDLYGPFYFCRAFIQARRAAGGGGRIVNVSSIHEEVARLRSAAYDAAKGGLRNLTRTLCLELAPERINVNAIAPGMILTGMNQEAIDDPEACEAQVANIPWKRAGQPHEVAMLAVYLASDDADYVTGQSFTIDGGLSLLLGQGA